MVLPLTRCPMPPRHPLLAALLFAASLASAQALPAAEPHNVVQLSASGSVEAQQDWLSIALSTTREGSEAGVVQAQLRQAIESALTELRGSAQAGAMEVRSGAFSLRPRYGKDGRINGWSGTAELLLEGTDFARIGAAVGRVQGLVVAQLQFGLSRQARTQLESQAQAQAIAGFKARALEIAHGFGFADYSLREVHVGTAEQPSMPMPRRMAMAAAPASADAPLPLEGGKSMVVVNVSGAVQLK